MSDAYEEEMRKEWEEEAIAEGRVIGFYADASGYEYGMWKGFGLRPQLFFPENDLKNIPDLIKNYKGGNIT